MYYFRFTDQEGSKKIMTGASMPAAFLKARRKYGLGIKAQDVEPKNCIMHDLSKQRRTFHITSYPQFSFEKMVKAFEDMNMFERKTPNCFTLK